MQEFGTALSGADEVVLTDIYAAGEAPIPGVTVEALAQAVRDVARGPVHVIPALDALPAAVADLAREGRPDRHHGRGLDWWRRRSHPDRAGRAGWGARGAMKVKAPAEKNFKRAKVKPGRAKRSRSRVGWKIARHFAAAAAVLLRRLPRGEPGGPRRAAAGRQDRRVRQCPAVDRGGRSADARPLRPQHPDRGPGRVSAPSARLAVDCRSRPAARAAVDDRGADRGAHADGHQPPGQPAVSDRPHRNGDRRVRAALSRVRPADHRRPGPVTEEGQAGDRRGARRARGRGARFGGHAALDCQATLAGRRLRRARRGRAAGRGSPRSCGSATNGSSSACSPISRWPRRCANGWRTSTTSTCDSTIACT